MTKYGSRILEKKEYVMMKQFQYLKKYMAIKREENESNELAQSISGAVIYDLEDMPRDIVRLQSQVTVSCEWGWSRVFELVLPYEEMRINGKISVDSALGAAVIGLSEGDFTNHKLLGQCTEIKIEKVLQDKEQIRKGRRNNIF